MHYPITYNTDKLGVQNAKFSRQQTIFNVY